VAWDDIMSSLSPKKHSLVFATKDQDVILSLPKFMSKMTGVSYIRQDHEGFTTLNYTNGEQESDSLEYNITNADSVFKIIGDVQAS